MTGADDGREVLNRMTEQIDVEKFKTASTTEQQKIFQRWQKRPITEDQQNILLPHVARASEHTEYWHDQKWHIVNRDEKGRFIKW